MERQRRPTYPALYTMGKDRSSQQMIKQGTERHQQSCNEKEERQKSKKIEKEKE